MATAKQQVKDLLNRKIRCTLDDGRTVEGKLQCLDRLKNIIVDDAHEIRTIINAASIYHPAGANHSEVGSGSESDDSSKTIVTRHMSQALIPGSHLVKVELMD